MIGLLDKGEDVREVVDGLVGRFALAEGSYADGVRGARGRRRKEPVRERRYAVQENSHGSIVGRGGVQESAVRIFTDYALQGHLLGWEG